MVKSVARHPARPRRDGQSLRNRSLSDRALRAREFRCSALGIALLCCFAGGAAAQEGDGDWPCMQRKVDHLAVAQLWSGAPLPEHPAWRDDPELAHLVALISARRTDLEQVRPMLDALGPAGGHSRDQRLVQLFAGVFDAIDRERSRIIAGVERYAEKQAGLAEQIDAREDEIRQARDAAAPDDHEAQDRIEAMQDQLAWDIRIFQDRRRSLSYVCESPVLLERRAFAAARMIQAELGR
jgi:hypothetical protein